MGIAEGLVLLLFFTPVGWIALLFVVALVVAVVVPKTRKRKIAAVSGVLLIAAMPLVGVVRNKLAQDKARDEAKARYDQSNALFLERCKSAGEKIVRTVSDVEGVVLLKVRPEVRNTRDQWALTDPYGFDLMGDGYISTFLRAFNAIATQPPTDIGYEFVEVRDPTTETYRYTGKITYPGTGVNRPQFHLVKTPTDGKSLRYAVTYDDISTTEDRAHWIAGSALRIIDLRTNEIVAERIGYMMDPGQGRTSGGSEPWERATRHACPKFEGWPTTHGQIAQAARFASKVLTPSTRN